MAPCSLLKRMMNGDCRDISRAVCVQSQTSDLSRMFQLRDMCVCVCDPVDDMDRVALVQRAHLSCIFFHVST